MRDQIELRAQDAVARCLMRRLIVPRIYFEAQWPSEGSARHDLVAIDRDGNGDAHVVEIRRVAAAALGKVTDLLGIAAPFRWVAFLRGTEDEAASRALLSRDSLYSATSAGRVGVIEVVEMTGGDLGANVVIGAERFPGSFYELSTAFSSSHKADVQY